MFDLDNAALLLMQRCVPFGTRCCRWRDVCHVINCTFDQPIIASDNCLSFAGLFLFPKSTKYLLGSPDPDLPWHTVIEQSNAATNPYFAISKSKTALEMVLFIILSKGHSCYIITSAIIKNKCIKVR